MEKKTHPSRSTFEILATKNWDTEKQTDKQEPTNCLDSSFKNIKVTCVACSFCRSFSYHGQKCCRNMGTSLFCSLVKPKCGPETGALHPITETKVIWISTERFI